MTGKRKPGFGWTPDLPDARDWRFSARRRRALPATVDLRRWCTPVENQGDLMSCTGVALASAMEYLERLERREFTNLSRLFIYYTARALTVARPIDDGAELRDAVKALARFGVCPEESWPYRASKCDVRPRRACYRTARPRRITAYQRLGSNVDEMRACLSEGFPFVFGFTMYDAFFSRRVARTGILKLPRSSEAAQGGHAVMAVGYDHAARRFLVRNSQGPKWGIEGYYWMSYEYLDSRDLAEDFWTIRRRPPRRKAPPGATRRRARS